jgi:hypothetical protein
MLVHSLGENVHINKEPFMGGTLPATPEGGIQVFLLMVATQRQPNPREDNLVIPGRTVEVPKQTGIKSDPKPAFAQHGKTTECIDGIRVQVDKFTPKKVHNGNMEFAWGKAKPSNKMGFKADNKGIIYHRNVYFRNERF